MENRVPQIVPLSDEAVEILRELKPLSGSSGFLFPGRDVRKPISNNTVNAALRRLGCDQEMFTARGFRSMASTLLNEPGWNPDAIERQPAHGERDKVRAAYNHAQYLPERRKMMAAWANYLDRIRQDFIPPRSKGDTDDSMYWTMIAPGGPAECRHVRTQHQETRNPRSTRSDGQRLLDLHTINEMIRP